jgi:hypothetical protein
MNAVRDIRFHLWRLRDTVRDRLFGTAYRREVFSQIHAGNLWGDRESVSGGGSNTSATEAVRRELPRLFERFGVHTILDAPCGDFTWMKDVAGSLESYTGIDIVPELIARNRAVFSQPNVSFLCADLAVDPLPAADLVLCRDCFIHLPTRLILSALRNFVESGAKYLLLTNSEVSAPYHDIPVGSFRPIDFRQAPFGFCAPEATIAETIDGTRTLGLWNMADIRKALDAPARNGGRG